MLAYRHLFHAGNAADVFKHVVLVRLLTRLAAKPKPFCYLDTHAGIAHYDLEHAWARKNAEYRAGIARVLAAPAPPATIVPYLSLVRAQNCDGELRYYPGSPRIARDFLRAGDRMVLCELNPRDRVELATHFQHDRQVGVHEIDAYQGLKAFLPPHERRGLVLIDSPFDRAGEFTRLADALAAAHRRWASGIYAIWYPLMSATEIEAFERRVRTSGVRKILRLELSTYPADWNASLRGSAMLLVNPPWQLDSDAEQFLPWLWRALSPAGEGRWQIEWLVPE